MCQNSLLMKRGTALCGTALLALSVWSHTPKSAQSAVPSISYTSDAATPLPVPKPLGTRAYVAARASRHGWTLMQWKCAVRLVNRENASWRVDAMNSEGSSAYGLFQILHMKKGTPLAKQVTAFMDYIESRYEDDPCKAWSHSLEKGWY